MAYQPEAFEFPSDLNGLIVVGKFADHNEIVVSGIEYSGPNVERLWDQALMNLLPPDFKPKTGLILGYGGGSAARVMGKKWPEMKITGVEIDPIMASIAEQFFELDDLDRVKLINEDAKDFVKSYGQTTSYSLVILNCILGRMVPDELYNSEFIKKLQQMGKQVLICYPALPQALNEADEFVMSLMEDFQLQTWSLAGDTVIRIGNS